MNNKPDNIIHINDSRHSIQELKYLIDALRKEQVNEFVVISSIKQDDEPDQVRWQWFGNRSTMYILGLVERIKMQINDYIRDNAEQLD